MDYETLFTMLRKASGNLKYPKIKFTSTNGFDKVTLYLATKGYVAIKVNSIYVGKVTPGIGSDFQNSVFRMYQGTTELQNEILEFCKNPDAATKLYGQRYSNCCFCGIELTNKASLQMGYGPICADNFGLPWFHTPEPEPTLADFDGKTAVFHKNDQY